MDCVQSHVSWMSANATLCGGEADLAGPTPWAFVPAEKTMHILFPDAVTTSDIAAVVAKADVFGAASSALWFAEDKEAPEIDGLGFERGWQPWWMESRPRDIAPGATDRVRLVTRVRPHDQGRSQLLTDDDIMLAEGQVDGQYAGRAWMIVKDGIAGLYDVKVWPPFRRLGVGRELVTVLAAAASRREARVITLNATPEGATLYASCGFAMLGEGRTYWRHRHH